MVDKSTKQKELIVYMAHDKVNGNCYFGSTFSTLEKRKRGHLSYAKRNTTKGHFYKSLAKRPEQFFWIELEREPLKHKPSGVIDRSLEQKWIDRYWGQPWVYNLKKTAMGGCTFCHDPVAMAKLKERMSGDTNPIRRKGGHSDYTKSLLSESAKKRPRALHTQETKDKISKAQLGVKKSEESRRRLSEAVRGVNHPRYEKPPWEVFKSKDMTVWKTAGHIYDFWKKTGAKRYTLAKNFRYLNKPESAFIGIYRKFLKGWTPYADPSWMETFYKEHTLSSIQFKVI